MGIRLHCLTSVRLVPDTLWQTDTVSGSCPGRDSNLWPMDLTASNKHFDHWATGLGVIEGDKVPPYFWAKIMKIKTQKLKVTPLIFNDIFENNESKKIFSTKPGGVRPLWKIPQNKMFFFNPSLRLTSHINQIRSYSSLIKWHWYFLYIFSSWIYQPWVKYQ